MNEKLNDLWMEAIINYCYASICYDDVMTMYYLGQAHILSEALNLSGAKLRFWWRVFDDCQKIICG